MAESNKEVVLKCKTTNLKGKKTKINEENKDKYNVGDIIKLKVGKNTKECDEIEIYCRIDKKIKLSINVTDLLMEEDNGITTFYINPEQYKEPRKSNYNGRKIKVYNVNEIEPYEEEKIDSESFSEEVDEVNNNIESLSETVSETDIQEHDQEKLNDMGCQQVAEMVVQKNEQDKEVIDKAQTELNALVIKETVKVDEKQSTSSNNTENKYTKEELDKKSIKDLRAICKELSIPNQSKLKKSNKEEYINAILNKNTVKTTVKESSLKKNESIIKKKRKTNKLICNNSYKLKNFKKEIETIKTDFIKFIETQHNLLRGSAVTGLDAYDDILHCLMLCYIEDKINKNELDITNSELDCYMEFDKETFEDYIKFLNITYLYEESEQLILNDGSYSSLVKVSKILSVHPKTCKIFKDGIFLNCKDSSIIQTLLKDCRTFYYKNINLFKSADILGIGYEHMTTRYSKGSGGNADMGQYFTERLLMLMCFALVDEEDIKEFINNDSVIGDEFCGTFGFPLYLKAYLKKEYNIDIKNENIYGVEYHERLSKYALMNSQISLNTYDNIICGDSFVTNVSPHLDFSVHNVPFGKSMNYDKIKEKYKKFYETNKNKEPTPPTPPTPEEYLPFCNKKIDAILSSQVALYKTKKMGLMIIKDGEETSRKDNSDYRKWFCEKCIIKKIMKIPSGAFSSTGTKTVCIYFIKKEGKQTETIQFLQLSDDGTKINEICNVSIEELKQNNYSWEPNSYILDETLEKMMAKSTCEWKKLGDICEMLPTTKHCSNIGKKEGLYRFYNSSQTDKLYLNSSEIEKESVIIGNGGDLCIHYDKKFTPSKHVTVIHMNNETLTKFIYYFMFYNINIIKNLTTGGAIQWLNKEKIRNINIPIPSIEKQKECVKILDDLTSQNQLLNDRKSGIKRQMKYYLETQIKMNDVEIKELNEIINIKTGKYITKDIKIPGEYPVYGGGNPSFYINDYNYENEIIIAKDGVSENCVRYEMNKFFLNHHGWVIHTSLSKKYLYYSLVFNENRIYKLAAGGGQKGINQENFKKLKIQIHTNEKQTEIVQYLDKLEAKKNSIDEEINDIDNLMKQVLELSYN